MNKCSNPAHPHCTQWVLPGDSVCASGHVQAEAATSFGLLAQLRAQRPSAAGVPTPVAAPAQLHISGFDPRAAGGRQALRLELRGIDAAPGAQLSLRLASDLLPQASLHQNLVPALHGGWRPVIVEFSSRHKEHGQYKVEAELSLHDGASLRRRWVCTLLLLVPRADASLTDIHRAFLSTHKNVRVTADDASVARVQARVGGGPLDIDVKASNAGIAHLDLDAPGGGKIDHAVSTLAWDEDWIEVPVSTGATRHPHPSHSACLVNAAPESLVQRHVRLFAGADWVLGRFERVAPEADVLLCHFGPDGQHEHGLTRRISGRHALIRRSRRGFALEDQSRYGLLIDGVWPGRHKNAELRLGSRISLTASIKGIVELCVTALLPHGLILHRIDEGACAECFYLLEPETHPGTPLPAWPALPQATVLPLIFHLHGGFWHLDPASGRETPLGPGQALDKLAQIPRLTRFASDPYPETPIDRNADLPTAFDLPARPGRPLSV